MRGCCLWLAIVISIEDKKEDEDSYYNSLCSLAIVTQSPSLLVQNVNYQI